MALTELVSNLSAGIWNPEASPQGSTPAQSPFAMPIGPGSSNTPTNAVTFATTNNGSLFYIQNSGNGISRRIVQGFNNLGYLAFFGNKQSKDNYLVPQGGISKRMNQGGIGFPFPIGPTGNVYDWKPNAHTGWNINNKYNNTIGAIYGTSGLADTYTTNSPIDDIYNKVKVRSEAWNRNSFGLATDQPFILRGIQRDNNSDPQYWGAFDNPNINVDTISDTPRGGLLTATEREAIDKVRIGKFLISPKGIFFAAKQLGLQASNPNVEGPTGSPSYNPIFNTKLWNPLSLFSLNTPVPYHITRHGIPGDPTGLSAYSYEKTVTTARTTSPTSLAAAAGADPLVANNRLVKLESEAFAGPLQTRPGLPYGALGGSTSIPPYIGGPKSFLGLGFTNQRRYTDTSLRQSSLLDGAPGLNFVTNPLELKLANNSYIGSTYDFVRYKDDNTYTTRDSPLTDEDEAEWSREGRAKIRGILEDPFASIPFPDSSKVLDKNDNTQTADLGKRYATVSYGSLARQSNYSDFRVGLDSNSDNKHFSIDPTLPDVIYTENNLFKKYDIPEYGAAELDRSDPTKAITATKDPHLDITNIDTKDLIEFTLQAPEFGSDRNGNALKLKFRAYISSISDSWSVQTTNLNTYFLNQALNTLGFDSTSRSISIDMTIPILAKADLVNAGNNLDLLARTMYGKGSGGKRRLPAMLLRIGNYTGTTVVLTSLSYDIDNETPWDIDNQTPMVVQVSMQFTEQDNAYTDGIRHGRVSTSNTLVYF